MSAVAKLKTDGATPCLARTAPAFIEDVQLGLCCSGQKMLPSKYLYDNLGSALFEVITKLPEYDVARAEHLLLECHADQLAELIAATMVIELGCGTAVKTRRILQAYLKRKTMKYFGIEVSPSSLQTSMDTLADLRGLDVHGVLADYLDGLRVALHARPPGTVALVLFLGNSLGNFDAFSRLQFLRNLRQLLRDNDALLLGNDLIKQEARMLQAYDDSLGVTAAFNLNLLVRMNRELGANFTLSQYHHRAIYRRDTTDIEMHLLSMCDQMVEFPDYGWSTRLREGETIRTETSHKYSLAEIDDHAARTGFHVSSHWVDQTWGYANSLLVAH